MLFRYYFFNKGGRPFEVADLLSYLNSNPYIDIRDKNESEKIAHYYNHILGFSADFVLSNKSNVPGIERLDASYSDVKFRVEFSVLIPTYDVNLIVNICEDICKLFNFYVYCEVFEDVSPFKRQMMVKAFEVVKKAYKNKYPEEVATYYRLDAEQMRPVYDYLSQSMLLKDLLKEDGITVPPITFYTVEGKRKVYTSIEVDMSRPFVFPAFVDMLHILNDRKETFISAEEFKVKCKKFLHVIESSVNNLFYINAKEMKKLNKIINKSTFSPLILELKQVEFQKVLDV